MEMREWHLLEEQPWREQAACRDYPTRWWFPERGGPVNEMEQARAICRRCPVMEACLDHAMDRIEEGIWGNTNVKERQRLRTVRDSNKRLICQNCRGVFVRPALDSRGMRAYCSRRCSQQASWRRLK